MAEYARPVDWPDVPLVDTDVHITPRSIGALLPYLPARWRDYLRESGVAGLSPTSTRRASPLSAIPGARPAGRAARLRPRAPAAQLLDPWRLHVAITHCIYGIDGIHNPDWAVAHGPRGERLAARRVARGRNRGCADRSCFAAAGPGARRRRRSTASATAREFVQVLLPVRMRAPLGTRAFWPIYAAAERARPRARRLRGRRERQPVTPVGCAELLPRGLRRAVRWPSRPSSSASSAKASRAVPRR